MSEPIEPAQAARQEPGPRGGDRAARKPRLGFLGTGWIGRHRMEAMLATGAVEAALIHDPSPEMLEAALATAPGATPCDSFETMLAAGLDGIVIATPSADHAAQSIQALQSGAAVFCQKPLGRNAAEAQAVVDAARTADRLLGVDFSYRHTEAMTQIAPLVRDGALGPIRAIDLTFHNAYGPGKPWFYDKALSGGGCVMDLGVHLVDLALWTLGWPQVETVTSALLADGQPAAPDQCEDYAVATLTLAGGVIVRLACSWTLQAGQEAVIEASFYGRDGGAALRNVGGSFYDFTADRFHGTTRTQLAAPPDAWGGRAAEAWARRLAENPCFDDEAARLPDVARVLDRIYAGR